MLISAAPVAIPVTTANPPTEAVAAEAAQKTPVPKPAASSDSSNTRNSTEANEQPKNQAAGTQVTEKDQSKDDSRDQSQQDQREKQQASEQRQLIEQLRSTDRSVRAHEAAHASVGGQLAGAPQLKFVQGPDGRRYAVSGEVSIDTSKVANDPQATIGKMLQVKRAALAPIDPSNQDFKVAAIAGQIASQARVELNLQLNERADVQNPLKRNDASSETPAQSSKRGGSIYFTNPIIARRTSLALNQKLERYGGLEEHEADHKLSVRA